MDGAPCPLVTGFSMACRFGGALLGSNGSSSSGGLLMGMSSSASGDRLESMALSVLSSDIDARQRTRLGNKCSDARRHHLSMAQGLLQVDEVGFDEGSWVSVRRVWVAKLPASVPRPASKSGSHNRPNQHKHRNPFSPCGHPPHWTTFACKIIRFLSLLMHRE